MLILNPYTKTKYGGGDKNVLWLRSPRKNKKCKFGVFFREDDPKLFQALDKFHLRKWHSAQAVPNRYRFTFRKLGLLVEKKELRDDVVYQLPIDTICPEKLKILGLNKNGNVRPSADLEINRRVLVPPKRLPKRLQRIYPLVTNNREFVWVWEPCLKYYYPVTGSQQARLIIQKLLTQKIHIDEVNPGLKENLIQCGILFSKKQQLLRNGFIKTEFNKCKREIKKRGAYLLKHFFKNLFLYGMVDYYYNLVRAGNLLLGDNGVHGYWEVDEPLSRILHFQSYHLIRKLVGHPCKPLFTYMILYKPGGKLEKHLDREHVDYALDIQLDYRSNLPQDKGWPIYIQKSTHSSKFEPFYCLTGDALLFQGKKLEHFRRKLKKNAHSLNLILLFGKTT